MPVSSDDDDDEALLLFSSSYEGMEDSDHVSEDSADPPHPTLDATTSTQHDDTTTTTTLMTMTATTDAIVPTSFDVLCGRGRTCFEFEGNQRFRDRIVANMRRYIHAASRRDKTQVVKDIIKEVLQDGGRFLKKATDGTWHDAGMQTAKQKTGHSLRDACAPDKVKCMRAVHRAMQRQSSHFQPDPETSSGTASPATTSRRANAGKKSHPKRRKKKTSGNETAAACVRDTATSPQKNTSTNNNKANTTAVALKRGPSTRTKRSGISAATSATTADAPTRMLSDFSMVPDPISPIASRNSRHLGRSHLQARTEHQWQLGREPKSSCCASVQLKDETATCINDNNTATALDFQPPSASRKRKAIEENVKAHDSHVVSPEPRVKRQVVLPCNTTNESSQDSTQANGKPYLVRRITSSPSTSNKKTPVADALLSTVAQLQPRPQRPLVPFSCGATEKHTSYRGKTNTGSERNNTGSTDLASTWGTSPLVAETTRLLSTTGDVVLPAESELLLSNGQEGSLVFSGVYPVETRRFSQTKPGPIVPRKVSLSNAVTTTTNTNRAATATVAATLTDSSLGVGGTVTPPETGKDWYWGASNTSNEHYSQLALSIDNGMIDPLLELEELVPPISSYYLPQHTTHQHLHNSQHQSDRTTSNNVAALSTVAIGTEEADREVLLDVFANEITMTENHTPQNQQQDEGQQHNHTQQQQQQQPTAAFPLSYLSDAMPIQTVTL